MKKTLAAIINEVRNNKGEPPVVLLTPDTKLREELGFSSLDLAELTVRIEERFGVDVFADGVVLTIGEIEEKLTQHSPT